MNNIPITIWSRKINDEQYEFNHVENGHCQNSTPTPLFDSQKAWKNGKWKKEFAQLIDNKIVRNL